MEQPSSYRATVSVLRNRPRETRARGLCDPAMLSSFERALEDSVTAVLAPAATSPIAEQVYWHFGLGATPASDAESAKNGACKRGKRLRPRVLFEVALAEGATYEMALDAALAIEYLHNYSLVHDDIEDGDEMRHGRQTVWSRYGVSHGVNAGDSLAAVSYLTLLRNSARAPLERVCALAAVLQRANLAMCAGQAHDIAFESASHVAMSDYLAMIEGKTAVLFGAACELGALCAGADAVRAAAYGVLGRAYGCAFQICDDVAGTWGARYETGKLGPSDIARRKWGFPVVWALGGGASPMRSAIATRYAKAGPLAADDVAAVTEALDVLGARRAAEEMCAALWREAARIGSRCALDGDGTVRALFEPGAETKLVPLPH